jgi:NTE family protein
MMKKKLAFVLSGGGARGALQMGALRALFEAGFQPDLLAGTSIGSANSTFIAVHGFNDAGLQRLEQVWLSTIDQDLLPTNLWWHTMQILFHRSAGETFQRVREFAAANGISPDLKFGDIQGVRLYLVAADLNSGSPVIFGQDLNESVLEGMLASMTLPPWMLPQQKEGRYLVDGAAVSNLPIEAAMRQGAGEIIALDLFDPNETQEDEQGLRPFIWKLDRTVECRQAELEIKLAEARGIRVRRLCLTGEKPVPIWDFRHAPQLIQRGYAQAQQEIERWQREEPQPWWGKLRQRILGENR